MFDHLDVRDEIEGTVAHLRATLPANTLRLISFARADLTSGPGWLQDGEWTPLPDPDMPARQLDFGRLCDAISARLDDVEDVRMCICTGEDDDGEPVDEWEPIDGSRERIIATLCGDDLARYVR